MEPFKAAVVQHMSVAGRTVGYSWIGWNISRRMFDALLNTLSPMDEYSRHYVFLYKPNHVHARPAFDGILHENQSQHSIGLVSDNYGGCDLTCVKFSTL